MGEKLKVLMFGSSGMVGHAVLHECLRNDDVEAVLSVGRRSTARMLGPALHSVWPSFVTTPEILGRAFIRAAQGKAPKQILESADIHALGST